MGGCPCSGLGSRGRRGLARRVGVSQPRCPRRVPAGPERSWPGYGRNLPFLTSLLSSREDEEEEEDSGEEGCSCLPCHLLKQCPRAPAGCVFYPRAA